MFLNLLKFKSLICRIFGHRRAFYFESDGLWRKCVRCSLKERIYFPWEILGKAIPFVRFKQFREINKMGGTIKWK